MEILNSVDADIVKPESVHIFKEKLHKIRYGESCLHGGSITHILSKFQDGKLRGKKVTGQKVKNALTLRNINMRKL